MSKSKRIEWLEDDVEELQEKFYKIIDNVASLAAQVSRVPDQHVTDLGAIVAHFNSLTKRVEDYNKGAHGDTNALRKDVQLIADHLGISLVTEPKTRKVVKVEEDGKSSS